MIPSYGHYGAGIATSIAEFMVTIVMIILGWKYYSIHFFSKQNVTYYLATGTIILLLLFLLALFGDGNLFFILGILMSVIVYISILYWRKDVFIIQMKILLINKIWK